MKKFYTFAVTVLISLLSFGATENFYSLSEEEMQKEFARISVNSVEVEVVASQWAEVINKAFETQNDRVIATVLRATAKTLNSLEKYRAIEIGAELGTKCPRILIEKKTVDGEHIVYLIMWDLYKNREFLLPIEYKTSTFAGKTATISKDAVKW